MTVRLAGVCAPCYSEGWDTWREGVARSFLPIAIKANYARGYLALVRPIVVMGAKWELLLRKKKEKGYGSIRSGAAAVESPR